VLIGSYLPTFRYCISVPSSRINIKIEYATDRLSRNVGNYQITLRNIPEERRPRPFGSSVDHDFTKRLYPMIVMIVAIILD
jgi:hypothetical protein